MSCHCILTTIVSDEKSAANPIENPWNIMSHFFLAASGFSLSLYFSGLTMMHIGMNFSDFILHRVCCVCWMYRLMIFYQTGKFLPLFLYIFFPLLSLLSCDSHCAYIWWCSPSVWGFVHFFLILFSFSSSDLLASVDPSSSLLILYSACSNLLSSPSSKIFFFCYFTSQFQNFCFALFNISISLLISIWCKIILILVFSSLDVVFFSSLNATKMAYLNICLVSTMSGLPQRQFTLTAFVQQVCYTFRFFECLLIFCWNYILKNVATLEIRISYLSRVCESCCL